MSIYNYLVRKPNEEILSMETYRGKAMLIVNTASKCAFTYQYEDLQKLQDKYQSKGFVVLGFPCNQFGAQNPEDGAATESFCKINFSVTFPSFDLVNVNGEKTHPLFSYLKHEVTPREFGKKNMEEKILKSRIGELEPDALIGHNLRWNFTKFLVDQNGKVIARFEPTDSMLEIEEAIEQLI
ncbi:MAG: glutathione peroxidase [Lysinibacillus sp.]